MSLPSRAVFLSYASQDAAAATRLATRLRQGGIEVWFDVSELKGGDLWDQRIRGQVLSCALFIPIISHSTQARREGYFRREWRLAVDRTHDMSESMTFLMPVVIDDTNSRSADVPGAFRSVQWTVLPDGIPTAAFVAQVARCLQDTPGAGATKAQPLALGPGTSGLRDKTTAQRYWFAAAGLAIFGCVLALTIRATLQTTASRPSQIAASAVEKAPSAPDVKSIAVLPFVDMSEKKDQEYFADGLAEELIDHLVRAQDLKVIARTSSFQFKGKSEDIRSIARQLGVANLLEGSVRYAGNTVRVTAQLVQASDGAHLWSQTYDRKLTDIFKVQEEISAAVGDALSATLMHVTSGSRPHNIEAYNLLLKANFFYQRKHTGDVDLAINQLVEALKLDPEYAVAWARLADLLLWQHYIHNVDDPAEAARIEECLRNALRIDPELAVAHVTMAHFHEEFHQDWDAARREYERAIALDPSGTVGRLARSELLLTNDMVSGRLAASVRDAYRDLERDPLDKNTVYFLSWALLYARHFEEARSMQRRMFELDPLAIKMHEKAAKTLVLLGDFTGALAEAEQEPDPSGRLSAQAIASWAAGRPGAARAAIDELQSKFPVIGAYYVAEAYAFQGAADEAFRWLDKARETRNTSLPFFRSSPFFEGLKRDARYRALLLKLHMPP